MKKEFAERLRRIRIDTHMREKKIAKKGNTFLRDSRAPQENKKGKTWQNMMKIEHGVNTG
jgi:hypothetical protein